MFENAIRTDFILRFFRYDAFCNVLSWTRFFQSTVLILSVLSLFWFYKYNAATSDNILNESRMMMDY
jgi:hypothetical protein